MSRVLICGSRTWSDEIIMGIGLDSIITKMGLDVVIVEGGAPGADLMAACLARARGLTVEEHPAKWDEQGRAAGPIRNGEMLDSGVSFVMAFSDKVEDGLAGGSGTEDCLRQAMRRGIAFVVISHDPRN